MNVKKLRYTEQFTVSLMPGTITELGEVALDYESRADVMREAIRRELERRRAIARYKRRSEHREAAE